MARRDTSSLGPRASPGASSLLLIIVGDRPHVKGPLPSYSSETRKTLSSLLSASSGRGVGWGGLSSAGCDAGTLLGPNLSPRDPLQD